MRTCLPAVALLLAATLPAAPAGASGVVTHLECSIGSDYDLQVTPAGLDFRGSDVVPGRVFMHDGQLLVDGKPVALDRADTARIRAYETQVRALLPEIAGIAREGVDIGFEALHAVAATLAGPDRRDALARRIDAQRTRLTARIDAELGAGQWHHGTLDRWVDDGLGDAVGELVGNVTGAAVSAALGGDTGGLAELQARTDSLDRSIERAVDARADALEARADALCPRLQALDRLQRQVDFRLPDGSPLRLMRLDEEHRTRTVAGTD